MSMGWQPETQPKGKPPVEKTKGAETMQRLIDADALKNDILKSAVMIDDRGIQTGYEIAIELIKRQPTIDAVPVRHGKWIWKGEDGDSRWMCSECKCKEYVPTCNGIPDIWDYCPNCGARMDEE